MHQEYWPGQGVKLPVKSGWLRFQLIFERDKEGVKNIEQKRKKRGTKRHMYSLLVRRVLHKQTVWNDWLVSWMTWSSLCGWRHFLFNSCWVFPLCWGVVVRMYTAKINPSLFSLFFNRLWNLFSVHAASRVKFCTKSLAPFGVKWRWAVHQAIPCKFNQRLKI